MGKFSFSLAAAGIAAAMLSAAPASASTLITSLTANNSNNGIMFDVQTGANALTLQSADIVMSSVGTLTFEVYSLAGGIGANLNNPGAWTLVSTVGGVVSSAAGSVVNVNFADFGIAANSTTGLYFTINNGDQGTSSRLGYNNGTSVGAIIASDGNLSIKSGYGRSYPFGFSFSPRNFAGAINYAVAAVPEPATWGMMILGFGLVGGALRRRQAAVRVTYA